jgi:hypothetical protein
LTASVPDLVVGVSRGVTEVHGGAVGDGSGLLRNSDERGLDRSGHADAGVALQTVERITVVGR